MQQRFQPPFAADLGNTFARARIDADGTVAQLSLAGDGGPLVFAADGGTFELRPTAEHVVEREYVGETSILRTVYRTASGRANVLDFLPVQLGPTADWSLARSPNARLIRMVEGIEGEVAFSLRFAPWPDAQPATAVVHDPNALLFIGSRTTVLLQSEASVDRHGAEVTGDFVVGPQEKRHFIVTQVDGTDPEVPELAATAVEWELDRTYDFWLAWARACPFQGVQRDSVMRIAALVKAYGTLKPCATASPYRLLAGVALAAWGWEAEFPAAMAALTTEGGADPALGWLLDALADAQESGLIESVAIREHWPVLQRCVDSLAEQAAAPQALSGAAAVSVYVGLQGAARIADDLLLSEDHVAWRQAADRLGSSSAPSDATEETRRLLAAVGLASPEQADVDVEGWVARGDLMTACLAVRKELKSGAYLQARRLMDRVLQAYSPLQTASPADGLGLPLWLAAQIYLQSPPSPKRVDMPGDLGD